MTVDSVCIYMSVRVCECSCAFTFMFNQSLLLYMYRVDYVTSAARSVSHCLRALITLERAEEAETAFADTVTLPLAK